MKKLYEITAILKSAVVIAADSKGEALAHVETWEECWKNYVIGVSDVELVEICKPRSQKIEDIEDEAHIIL